MNLTRFLPLVSAVAAASALALAPAAGADTIVYVKASDGTLWIAQPSGSNAQQVSSQQMRWPSESNNGTIVAQGPGQQAPDGTAGADIWVFHADGSLDHRIATPADYSTTSCPTYAPQHVRITSDGSKIAYDRFFCDHFSTVWTPTSSTGLNFPNQTVGQEDFTYPSWMSNTRMVMERGTDLWTYDAGNGDNSATSWFTGTSWGSEASPVASPDGSKIAVVENDAANNFGFAERVAIKLFATNGGPPAAATPGCEVNIPYGQDGYPNVSPSFSPDGRRLLFGEPDGIHVADVSNMNDCSGISNAPLVIPGGTQGFWSGATEVSVQNPNPGPGPGPNPNPINTLGTLTAQFSWPSKVRAKHKALFNASKSSDQGAAITRYVWSFGDHSKNASGKKVKHTFKKPGKYTVAMTVYDSAGRHVTAKGKVKVKR